MGYFHDTRTCEEHGFVLSPDGDCVRCRSEALTSEERLRVGKIASIGAVFLAATLGLGVAWGRARTAPPAPVAAATAPVARVPQVAAKAPEPAVPARDVNWEMAAARAEAEREQAAARAEAEREQAAAAPVAPTQPQVPAPVEQTTTTYVVTRQGPRVTPPTPDPTDAWWNSSGRTRVVRSRGVYGGAAAASIANAGAGANGAQNPAAWGLPPNRGGFFTTRSGGH